MSVVFVCPHAGCNWARLVLQDPDRDLYRCPSCSVKFRAALPPPSATDTEKADPAPPAETLHPPGSVAPCPLSPPSRAADETWTDPLAPGGTAPVSLGDSAATVCRDNDGPPDPEGMPRAVGRFVVRERLGEGAFGVVYRAHDPQLDREVALKVAKAGALQTERQVERFLREARSAAQLRHPSIVPLFEAGQSGGAYFLATAFIRGRTLESAVQQGRPGHRDAARIVRSLAEALAYAHSLGIVHRDVKPANVMLDEKAQPILMDFGLAARHDGSEKLTQDGAIIGTPLYMSPEQAAGKSGDPLPASDQYSLGVILYELLTGKTPFAGTTELVLFLHQSEGPPPPRRHDRAVPRDLETICLKCLEKEPGRRYPDCQALADDLRRWLEGEPIQARRLSVGERLVRWVKREPRLAVASAVAVLALVTVAVVMTISARVQARLTRDARNAARLAEIEAANALKESTRADEEARKAREESERATGEERKARAASEEARREASRAQKAATFLTDLFKVSDPTGLTGYTLRSQHEKGQTLTARELLDRGAKQIAASAKDEPLVRAALLDTIGDVYRSLGLFDQALPLLESSLEIRKKELPDDHLDVAASLFHLGFYHNDRGDFPKAEELYRQALDIRLKHLPADDPLVTQVKLNLGWTLAMTGEDGAEKLLREVVKARKDRLGDDHYETAVAKAALAGVLIDQGKMFEAALPGAEAMKFILEHEAGGKDKGSPLKAVGLFQMAMLETNEPKAEKMLRECHQIVQDMLGRDHLYNCLILHALGQSLESQNRLPDAEAAFRDCLAIARKSVGLEHPRVSILVYDMADLLARRGKAKEGQELFREMLDAQRSRFGDRAPGKLDTLSRYAAFEARHGDRSVAETTGKELLALLTKGKPPGRKDCDTVATVARRLGLNGVGDVGRDLYRAILPRMKELHGETDANYVQTLANFSEVLLRTGRHAEAEKVAADALKLAESSKRLEASTAPMLWSDRGEAAWGQGKPGEAEEHYRAALDRLGKIKADANDLKHVRLQLAGTLVEQKKYPAAVALLEEFFNAPVGKTPFDREHYQCLVLHYQSLVWLEAKDAAGYRKTVERMWSLWGTSTNHSNRMVAVRAMALGSPEEVGPLMARAIPTAEDVLPRYTNYLYGRQALAWHFLKAGKPAEARKQLNLIVRPANKVRPLIEEALSAWMARQEQNNPQTTEALQKAMEKLDETVGASSATLHPRNGLSWHEILELRHLARQARSDGG